jgi:hypothetical protein
MREGHKAIARHRPAASGRSASTEIFSIMEPLVRPGDRVGRGDLPSDMLPGLLGGEVAAVVVQVGGDASHGEIILNR